MLASFLFFTGAVVGVSCAHPAGSQSDWWQPEVGATWQIQLDAPLKNISWARDIYDFDLFDNPASTVTKLHSLNRKTICYFSAGSWEKWRPDAGEFKPKDLGKPLAGWAGERWLNVSSPDVRKIMAARLDLAKTKGCDAVDPDNVDGYDNKNGLGLTQADAVNYVQWLADQAHQRGMASGLKNAGAIVGRVLSNVDFQVNEQCAQYHECNQFAPFINAGKPVFHIEYPKQITTTTIQAACDAAGEEHFSTLIKHLNLNDWAITCP